MQCKGLLNLVKAMWVTGLIAMLLAGCGSTDGVTLPEEELEQTATIDHALSEVQRSGEPQVLAAPGMLPVDLMDPRAGYCGGPPFEETKLKEIPPEYIDVTVYAKDIPPIPYLTSGQFANLRELTEYLEKTIAKATSYKSPYVKIRRLTIVAHSGVPGLVRFGTLDGSSLWSMGHGLTQEEQGYLKRIAQLLGPRSEVVFWQCEAGWTGTEEAKQTVQSSLGRLARLLGAPVWAPRCEVKNLPSIPWLTVTGWTKVYPDGRMVQTGYDGTSIVMEITKAITNSKKGSCAE